jgi:FkbM family methyltransferase
VTPTFTLENLMTIELQSTSELVAGRTDTLMLSSGVSVPVRLSQAPLAEAVDAVLLRRPEDLTVLARLPEFPALHRLLEGHDEAARLAEHKRDLLAAMSKGIQVFGAHRIGQSVVNDARRVGIAVHGLLDNDSAKAGQRLDGIEVFHPAAVDLSDAVVVVASGRYSNDIIRQIKARCGLVVNFHEFLYATDSAHGPEPTFANLPKDVLTSPLRYVSAFLRLDDEQSRQAFNGLIDMRMSLSIEPADAHKSPFADEYFDKAFVSAAQAHHFVDAGAFNGDTLASLERHFGPVERAYLFEPEMAPYYSALKRFSDRPNVLLFNMGLDSDYSRFEYDPVLSCNLAGEVTGPIPDNITSYIQGVPLDHLVQGKVGLFKLDIEGMEERALLGASTIIQREKPVLAVCAYHRADDFWKLIDTVTAIRPDYRVAIRHYADILHDISLYFY